MFQTSFIQNPEYFIGFFFVQVGMKMRIWQKVELRGFDN